MNKLQSKLLKLLKIELAIILILATLGTPVSAQPTDSWLIENAIESLQDDYPKYKYVNFNGVVTTGWHTAPALHKHVTITARYGYEESGYVRWSGRSYATGGTYTMTYIDQKPEPKFQTVIHNTQYMYTWNGKGWTYNTPTIQTIDGKTHVIYPIP